MTYERMKGPAHSRDKHDRQFTIFPRGLTQSASHLSQSCPASCPAGQANRQAGGGSGHTGHTP
jgi:hypothetical protein